MYVHSRNVQSTLLWSRERERWLWWRGRGLRARLLPLSQIHFTSLEQKSLLITVERFFLRWAGTPVPRLCVVSVKLPWLQAELLPSHSFYISWKVKVTKVGKTSVIAESFLFKTLTVRVGFKTFGPAQSFHRISLNYNRKLWAVKDECGDKI